MRVKSVHVREFKRFTDLQVRGLPETAKLVILVGPNGSGKSSLFEAFNFWTSPIRGWHFQKDYHWKVGTTVLDDLSRMYEKIRIEFHNEVVNPHERTDKVKKTFYFRSAYRHEPDFTTSSIGELGETLDDARRPPLLISPELRVSDNYQRIVSATIDEIYNSSNANTLVGEVRERLIGKIRAAMQRVFGDLVLTGPGKPMVDGTFFFEKGASKNYRYKSFRQ